MTDKIAAGEWRKNKKIPARPAGKGPVPSAPAKKGPFYGVVPGGEKGPGQALRETVGKVRGPARLRGKFAYDLGLEAGMAKAAGYVPESFRLQQVVDNHRARGHEVELARLKAKHEASRRQSGKESGRFGGGLLGGMLGAGIGTFTGMVLGDKSGIIGHEAGAALGVVGGSLTGGLIGRAIGGRKGAREGAAAGRAYGTAEANKRNQGVMATEGMGDKQKSVYFSDLIAQKQHKKSINAQNRMARAMEERADAAREAARAETSREAREWSDRAGDYYGRPPNRRSHW
jgi:hypothetical protein